MRGYVRQRFINPDGTAKPEGVALRRDYEAGMARFDLAAKYHIGAQDFSTLRRLLDLLGAKRRRVGEHHAGLSTYRLMQLYAEMQDCTAVARVVGRKPMNVYQRLRRAGWTELKGANA